MRARAIAARRKAAREKIAAMRRIRSPEVEPAPAPRGIGPSEYRMTGL